MLVRYFAQGQTHSHHHRYALTYVVAPKIEVNDELSRICANEGPGASLYVLEKPGDPTYVFVELSLSVRVI